MKIIWQIVRRITNEILGVKGLNIVKYLYFTHFNLFAEMTATYRFALKK